MNAALNSALWLGLFLAKLSWLLSESAAIHDCVELLWLADVTGGFPVVFHGARCHPNQCLELTREKRPTLGFELTRVL